MHDCNNSLWCVSWLRMRQKMTFRIVLAICYCHLVQGFLEDIDSSQQCSNSTAPASFASGCDNSEYSGNSKDNESSGNSEGHYCPLSVRCLNVLWTEFKPYSYQKDSRFMGIIPGTVVCYNIKVWLCTLPILPTYTFDHSASLYVLS